MAAQLGDIHIKEYTYVLRGITAAQSLVDPAESRIKLVEQGPAVTQIRASFAGLVVEQWLSPRTLATTLTPVVSLISEELVVYIQVEDTALGQLRGEARLILTRSSLPGQQVP